jgi:type I restriction-modification system DNA methylase subunit
MFCKTGKKINNNANDIIYTPKPVALKMIDMCDIKEGAFVLDPSKGGGIFYDNLPTTCVKDYCEITENKDFFEYNKSVDLIIGNPPYSLWDKWIEHTVKITNKFCYILGCLNFTDARVRKIFDNGFSITKIHLLKIDWWYSPSFNL